MSESNPAPVPESAAEAAVPTPPAPARPAIPQQQPGEIGGPRGLEPTRFGDWECKGRCSDF